MKIVASLLLLAAAPLIEARTEYSCCKNSDCGGECLTVSDNDLGRCANGLFNGEEFPYLCMNVVCCQEENCGGQCEEDIVTDRNCELMVRKNFFGNFSYVCDEDNAPGDPYKCCDDDCVVCRETGFWFGGPDVCADTTIVKGGGTNLRNSCPPVDKCCKGSCDSGRCQMFEFTPENCEVRFGDDWVLCGVVDAGGDPHIQLWNHSWFDYHGECDLVFLDAPEFLDNTGLTIHIRTTRRYEYSSITSVAVKLGEDTLEVSEYGTYALNGVFDAGMPNALLGQYPITHQQINKKRHLFRVEMDHGETMEITTFRDIVSISLHNAHSLQGSKGLLGQFGTGKMLARDGKTIIEDPVAFGNEWQVHDDEPMIFQSVRAPQYPEQCILGDKQQSRRLGASTVSKSEAEKACSHLSGALFDNCVFDVMAIGDLDIADVGAY